MKRWVATYVVNAEADDLEGWTSGRLAVALKTPLERLGVRVELRPYEYGLGGLSCSTDLTLQEEDALRAKVREVVDRIIQRGRR